MANQDVISQLYNVGAVFVSSGLATGSQAALIQVPRVQSVGLNFSIGRTDINQLGQMNRIDNIITTPPTVNLTMDYFATDGFAENALGFSTKSLASPLVSGFLDRTTDEKNYYLQIAREGYDAIGSTDSGNNNVFAVGNGYVTNYSINMAVGEIPRASVSIEGANFQSYTGTFAKSNPAIDPNTDAVVAASTFTLPTATAYTGTNIPTALRHAEIFLSLPRDASVGDYLSGVGKMHVNSVNLSVPINRTQVNELGHLYPIARKLTPPVPFTLSLDALAADVSEDSISALRCSDGNYNFRISMCKPNCGGLTGTPSMIWDIKGAKLESRDYSLSVGGGPATVRTVFNGQLSALGTNTDFGVFMSGAW
jgi:hypothetical protein